MKKISLTLLLLTACASTNDAGYLNYLAKRNVAPPTREALHHCQGYGCRIITEVAVEELDWENIANLFDPPPADAAEERARVAQAIGLFEQIAGAQAGTEGDVGGTFRQTGEGQLDCVDESTNTTVYLAALQSAGYLRFHTVEGPTMRLPIINAGRWPHQTAVFREKTTGIRYAVDSWFQDNGASADIVELTVWKKGWKPENVHGFL